MVEQRLNKRGKPSIIRWGGLLYGMSRGQRAITFGCIVLLIVALSFTQFGFVGVGEPDDFVGYGFTLLAPVALGALLLGVGPGTLLGLVAGAVLLLHSRVQPLDYYEVMFITPTSSIALFTLAGLFTSLFLAIALRKHPSLTRQIVYIAIVCFISSAMFSFTFMLNVFTQLIIQIADTFSSVGGESAPEMEAYAASMLGKTGSLLVQVDLDAALMFVACLAGVLAVRAVQSRGNDLSLRTKFRGVLLLVVAIVFMVTTPASFGVITEQAKQDAQEKMQGEIGYLTTQLKAYDARIAGLDKLLASNQQYTDVFSEEDRKALDSILDMDSIIDGYTKDADGVIVVFSGDTVLLSDDGEFSVGSTLDDYIGTEGLKLMMGRAESQPDQMYQITYDSDLLEKGELKSLTDYVERDITTQVAYMCMGKYDGYKVMMIMPTTMVFAGRNATMAWTAVSALVLLVVVFVLVSQLLNRIVVRRIDETNGVLGEITDGNLDARVNITDSREFKSLSTGINTTVGALKGWIAEAEQRMDAELETAKAIQESALPRIFPPFPDVPRFDVYAAMNAARRVGGDFYDFFLIGDNCTAQAGKLGFVIADVSGKGVPAALFMMTAKTEIRNFVGSGMELGEAIENVNRQLCDGNDAGMFVTAFVGVLDYGTGHMVCVNAGHNPPLLWQAGAWRWLKEKSGLPLGLFDGLPYSTYEYDLEIGDELFTYTDGVTEAMDVQGELYGEERLESLVNDCFYLHPRALVQTVRQSVARHAHGAEQSDDITMLALEFGVPPELTATMVVQADTAELPNVLAFVHSELDRRLCPVRTQNQLDIAIEELFVNVCHYAYPDLSPGEHGVARISCTYSADPPSVTVELADGGIPYNPLAKPDAVTPDDIMDVPIGGLGILMAKNSVDEMTYERLDDSNVVTIVKKW